MQLISSDQDAWAAAAALAREFPNAVFIVGESKFQGITSVSADSLADSLCHEAKSIAQAAILIHHEGFPVLLPDVPFAPE